MEVYLTSASQSQLISSYGVPEDFFHTDSNGLYILDDQLESFLHGQGYEIDLWGYVEAYEASLNPSQDGILIGNYISIS